MKIWLDAHLSPALAAWVRTEFSVDASPVRDLGLRDSSDDEIFAAAKQAGAIIMTKDRDFVTLLLRHGPPPRVIWVTCGNTSNARMKQLYTKVLSEALDLIAQGEPLVEIGDRDL